jgi:DsbC/DsbD-like thiol-disulfide interchange protein
MFRGTFRPTPLRNTRRALARVLSIAVAIFVFGACVWAQSTSVSHARVALIADQSSFTAAHPLRVGFLFRLEKGWHIYWQNPGDSGEPPRVEWKLPAQFRAGAIEWPRPIRLGTGTIIDYGYNDQVLLMVAIRPSRTTASTTHEIIAANVKYLVCREICVPGKASLSLTMPLSGGQSLHLAEWHKIFQQTRKQLPKAAPSSWKISAASDKAGRFVLSVKGSRERQVAFFPLDPSVIENSAPQIVVPTDDGFSIVLQASEQLLKAIPVLNGLLVFGDGRTFQIAAPVYVRSR